MDVLIVLGSTAAYVYSVVSILVSLYSGIIHPMFFETSAMLISVVLLGKYTESIAKGRTSEAMERLLDLQPSTASVCVWDDPKERFQLDKYLLQLEADLARQQLEDGAGGSSAHTNRDREEAKASQAGSSDSKGDDKPSLTTQLAEQLSTCITRCVDFRLVQVGDVIKVGRGEKVPCDGVVVCGQSSVDEAIITGESMPQSKRPGSDVIGCTVNMSSVLYVKVRAIGSDTVLSRVVQLVNDAQTQKAPIQDFANRVAAYFVPMVVAFSALTFVVWYVVLSSEWVVIDTAGDSHFLFSLMFAIAVLVVSCPCSLGLATPTAVMVGAGVAAKLGILFKGGVPLEVTGRADVVMFDKTGTLTKGQPNVDVSNTTVFDTTSGAHTEIYGDVDEEIKKTFWALVAACETDSEHIIGRAIVGYFHKYVGAKLPAHTDFHAGTCVCVCVYGHACVCECVYIRRCWVYVRVIDYE
jgi:Cu+-exporting ATPase